MGIKDKVINILFDDDEVTNAPLKREKSLKNTKSVNKTSLNDTNPVFIDANPKKEKLVRSEKPKEDKSETNNIVEQLSQEETYRMTENISPIYGIIHDNQKNKKGSQSKKNDNIKMYDGLMNAGINQVHTYSSEIISPIYGPIVNKPTRKNQNRPHKKQADPFNRNIDDTGEFKTLFVEQDKKEEKEELDFETDAPNFEVVNEQDKTVVDESLGDTDRLSKISDHINQIKNEAAHIYSNEKVEYTPKKEEKDDTLSHSTISDLIHNFQKEDFNPNLDLFIKEKEPEEDLKTYDDVSEDTDYSEEEDYFDDNSEEDDNKGNSIISKLIIEEPKEKDILEETLHRASSFQKELNEQLEETNEVIEDVEPVEETFDIEESDNVAEDINDEVTEDSHDDVNEEIIEEDHDDIFDNVEESNSSVADDILNESLEETKDLFSDLFGDE